MSQTELSTELVPDPDVYRRKRSYNDLYSRALVAPAYYVVGCVILLLIGGFSVETRNLIAGATVLFLVFWVLRYNNHVPPDFTDELVCAQWSRRQWALVHTGYLLWGLLAALVAVDQAALTTVVFAMAVAVGLFGSAGTVLFSVNLLQQRITLAVLHWPVILTLLAMPSLRELGVILFCNWLLCTRSATHGAREYDTQISLEHDLLVSRSEVQALARTDGLTGLANRHEYISRFNLAWTSAQRNRTALALAVIDLDHFKAVNDCHGHLAGDACLKHVASLLRQHFRRADDFVARIGGEEFVAVLPSTTLEVAHRICEEFRVALAMSGVVYEGHTITVTASIGVGEVATEAGVKPDENFARIDAATYQAKAQGRNQTVIAAKVVARGQPVLA
ncbi:MAG: GGDEF domain-containing protein [Rhodocyclaceae bacterium]|nr:GGDEF domain-containing protein [Rhodocyclaceae bacterium]MBL0074556.1 GGDEF domain-containing protein [Rhodocyclaceae bacterium]MBP6109146.1 GGDEF domain-containing protein [Rhodocyclaceae bacterium]MBP6278927.1 GGDEF domain-containing protein [Rhodocyclaceae bacterium]